MTNWVSLVITFTFKKIKLKDLKILLKANGMKNLILKDKKENSISYTCSSTWNPPFEWAKKITTICDLIIKIAYCETGMGFYGYSIFKDGKDIEKKYYEIDVDDYEDDEYEDGGEDREAYIYSPILAGNLKKFVEKEGLINVV